jgi:hypothetical protein
MGGMVRGLGPMLAGGGSQQHKALSRWSVNTAPATLAIRTSNSVQNIRELENFGSSPALPLACGFPPRLQRGIEGGVRGRNPANHNRHTKREACFNRGGRDIQSTAMRLSDH